MEKIDVFCHVMLPKYKDRLYNYSHRFPTEKAVQEKRPALTDLQLRMRKAEEFPGYKQIITTTMPPIEEVVDDRIEALDLARLCNDEMAETVSKHPDFFVAAVANIPLLNIDDALREMERAIRELRMAGVQVYTRSRGRCIAAPEFSPIFEMAHAYGVPVWIHPYRSSKDADYPTEDVSYHQIFSIFGWPYETTVTMTRLIFSGIFERMPDIKIIVHHSGGMVPFLADRIVVHHDNGLERLGLERFPGLTKHPIEYYKMFFADTALNGNPNALRCAIGFYGEDHMLFATDMPYDVEQGAISIRNTIGSIEALGLPDTVREKLYCGNIKRLLGGVAS